MDLFNYEVTSPPNQKTSLLASYFFRDDIYCVFPAFRVSVSLCTSSGFLCRDGSVPDADVPRIFRRVKRGYPAGVRLRGWTGGARSDEAFWSAGAGDGGIANG